MTIPELACVGMAVVGIVAIAAMAIERLGC